MATTKIHSIKKTLDKSIDYIINPAKTNNGLLVSAYGCPDDAKGATEPYYYSYEYYSRFGEFPFGERGHGLKGVVEVYQQLFNEPDLLKVCKLLSYVSHKKYRGHLLCPCGSGIITRKCHGKNIFPFICDNQLNDIAFRDYEEICKEIRKYG